ncbi:MULTISPECIES: hypothetical protein [Heyndrickxia]|nr:hypothetical protein [Heyndrickxia oleronia]
MSEQVLLFLSLTVALIQAGLMPFLGENYYCAKGQDSETVVISLF